ncbi:MAG: UTP--glucose-1-phosphate uridylyltransferase [Candidatus Saccharimonadales bacterium]
MKQPTKAVICAAGLGTRFLPQTKAMPKEMLPIIDRPVIQLIVEEAVAAGVTEIIIVTGSTKRSIEDHFDRSDELEAELREKGKNDKADQIKNIAEMANFIYVRQKGTPKGNARPVLNVQHLIDDDEPFFVFFADDFFRAEVPRAVQLLEAHKATGKSVISLIEVDKKDADKYGMAAIKSDEQSGAYQLTKLVEKPGEANAPSNLASIGGYLLTPDILPLIAKEQIDKNGEITLADSINELAQSDEVYGRIIEGVWHDTGDQLKYIKAVVDVALESSEYGEELHQYLVERLT